MNNVSYPTTFDFYPCEPTLTETHGTGSLRQIGVNGLRNRLHIYLIHRYITLPRTHPSFLVFNLHQFTQLYPREWSLGQSSTISSSTLTKTNEQNNWFGPKTLPDRVNLSLPSFRN